MYKRKRKKKELQKEKEGVKWHKRVNRRKESQDTKLSETG